MFDSVRLGGWLRFLLLILLSVVFFLCQSSCLIIRIASLSSIRTVSMFSMASFVLRIEVLIAWFTKDPVVLGVSFFHWFSTSHLLLNRWLRLCSLRQDHQSLSVRFVRQSLSVRFVRQNLPFLFRGACFHLFNCASFLSMLASPLTAIVIVQLTTRNTQCLLGSFH